MSHGLLFVLRIALKCTELRHGGKQKFTCSAHLLNTAFGITARPYIHIFSSGTLPPVLKGHWRLELRQLLKLLPIRNSNELRLTDSIDRLNLNLKKLRYDRREPQLVLCRSVQTSQFNFRAELHHGALNYCRSSLRFSALMKP